MATLRRRRSKWRAQVRRGQHALSKTFALRIDAEKWAREIERSIDQDLDPTAHRFSARDSFASLIVTHIDDLKAYGKPLRRSKEAVLNRLQRELGEETIGSLTRERLMRYGMGRAKSGAGPATLAIDFSFIGTNLPTSGSMSEFAPVVCPRALTTRWA